jgi:hypothetical protein
MSNFLDAVMILLLGELGVGAGRHAKVIEEAPPAH